MIDRQWLGDVALAALIALPGAALARPYAVAPPAKAAVSAPQHNPAVALAFAADRQVGFSR